MKHLNAILFFVLLLVFRLPAQSVTYLEYFIDSNPERGQGTQVVFPAGADRTVSFNVPLTNVPFGIHNLYVRAKDQGGHWSFVSSRPFIKAAVDLNKFPEITVLQYFFDNDPGIELADRHTFTPDTAKTLAFNIPLNDIDYGFHNLYMRAKDEYGHWSFVSSRPFLKESVDLYATPNIAALEYFIDTDPGYGAGHTIFGNFADSLAATFTVDLSELADGTHTLFVRGKDEYGRWSLVDSRPFIKEALDLYQPPKINSLRYCFTSGAWRSSEYVYQGFTSGVDRTLNFMADLSGLEVDQTYTLHIYGLDEQGHPAFRQQHNFTVDAPTTVALSIYPTTMDFGSLLPGSRADTVFTFSNTGSADLNIQDITLSTSDTSDFQLVSAGEAVTLAPGASKTDTLRFAPQTTGNKNARLIITSNAPTSPDTVEIAGKGVSPQLAVSTDTLNFNNTLAGSFTIDSVLIKNSGSATLNVDTVQLAGADSAKFLVTTPEFELAAGDSQFLKIKFLPDSAAAFTALLKIYSDGGNDSVTLHGSGIAPQMKITPLTINYENILVHETAGDSILIQNSGSAALALDTIRVSGADAANFVADTTLFSLASGDSQFLPIHFTPDRTAEFSAQLLISGNAGNQSISLTGNCVNYEMTVASDTLKFGQAALNTTLTDSVVISNTGTLALLFDSIRVINANRQLFLVDTTAFTLAAGDSQILPVSFTPDISGNFTAQLKISSEAGQELVHLQGFCVVAELTVTPPALDFGNVRAGNSALDSIKIKNTGLAKLELEEIKLSGTDSAQFETDTTIFSLAPGDSQFQTIRFIPNSTGEFSAVLDISSTGGNRQINLSGTGVETKMTVSRDSIRFGEVQLQATVRDSLSIINSGTLELDIYSIKLQGTAARHFAVDTTKFKLAPGDSQVLQISFTPDSSGSLTAALEITSNGGNESIALAGVGIAPKMTVLPPAIDFGSIQVKTTAFDSVRITNAGSAELQIDSIRITGVNPVNFSTDTTRFTLAPGDSHSLEISFAPDLTKKFTAALSLVSNGGNETIALAGTGVETKMTVSTDSIRFGEVQLQATVRDSLSITNSGTLELDISSIKLQGSAARHFAVDTTKFKLAPGDSQVLQISFTPDTSGSLTAALEITSNGGNKSIVLSGVGNAPKMTVLPPAIDFENVSVDTTAFDSIIIKNSGTAKLKADSIRVIGANFDNFSADTTLFALAPGDSHSLKISFTPDTTKDFSAALHLASNGGNETVALAGTGIKMEIAASRDSINFGAVELQRTARDSLTISNPGSLELNVYSIVLEGLAAGNFTVDTTRFKLAPGDSQLLPISFTPDTSGRRLAVLKFVSNAGNKIVRLIGTGVETEMKVSADSTDFGPVLVGAARLDSVRILNSGTIELQIDSLRIRGIDRDNFAVDTTTFALAPGDSQFLVINFTPDSVNTFRAWLQIYHSGGSQRTIFTGSGIAPQLSTVPPTLDFGEVLLGETGIDSVLLRNLGQAQLKVDTLRISGAHPANFISNAPLPALAPGDSLFQKISFTPHRAGSFTAILEIKSDGGESNIALTGTGIKIELTLAADTLDFHQVQMNSTALDSLLLINTGNIVLKIDSLRLQGKNTKNFLADSRAFFLAAGDSHFLKIEFIPDARGSFSAALKIFGTAGEQQIFLTGSGIAPLLAFSHTNFNFGTLPLEFDSTQTLKIMNRGNTVLALDSLKISGGNQSDFTIPNYDAGSEIKAAGLLNVPVRFSPQAEGTRNALLVGWSNCVSSPDTVFLAGEGFHLALEVEHDSTATLGESLDFTVAQPQHFQPTITRLYYRCTGQQKWKFIELQSTGEGYNVIIPPDSITNRGVEYFISLADSTHEITYPALNARENPALIRVAIEQYFSPVSLPKITYKMVSVPIDLDQPDIASVLADDFGEYDIQHWRLVRWQEGAVQDYVENAELAEQFVPGTAFWLITREGKIFDVENGRSVDASEPFRVRLAPGWNQVGNPFAFPVAWHDIEAPETVGAPVWFDGIEYSDYNVPVLQPWEGYFIQNRSERVVEIAIPAKEAVRDLGKAANRLVVDSENEYILQIAARIPRSRLIDTQNYIGWRQQATNSRDRLDFSEAPPIGEFLQLSIIEDEEKFAGNFKSLTKEGQRWEMQLTATLPRSKIQIDLIETGNLPETFGLYVLDQDYRCIIPVRQNSFEIYLDKQFPVRHLKMILGTEEYAQLHSSGIPLVPIEYALKQNFPNPFNPATTIQYQLSRRGAVLLEIYNMLGQRTRLLVDKIQNTGNHAITWNGRDDTGKAVASGVYLCKIKAGKFSATRKLILVR
ncbi:MAG: choice-of-anchor D domain-containing protein [Methanosarcinaceae archaeon]